MSTTLLIGRWPAAVSRAFSHAGDGPIVTSSNARAVKRGHRPVSTTHLDRHVAVRCSGIVLPRRLREPGAGRGVHLARDAVDAEAVRPVGRDLELEHLGRDRQHAGQRLPDLQAVVLEHDRLVVVGADRQLVLGEDHPVRRDAAQLRLLELRAVGHDRARPRDRDGLAGRDVRRAADDLRLRRRRRSRRVQTVSRSASGWRAVVEHASDDERVEVADAVVVDALDLGAGHRKARRRARAHRARRRSTRASQSSGTLIRTAPGSARRCRRTAAGPGPRA